MAGWRRRSVLLGVGNVLVAFSLLGVLLLVLGSRGGPSDEPSHQTSPTGNAVSTDVSDLLPTATAAAVASGTAPPTAEPGPTPTATPVQTLLDEAFADNRMTWPDNPQATAWLGDGGYHLLARRPGQFVAVGAPLPEPLGDVIVMATFRKVGGPPGGGYGLIVRDQGPEPRDGMNQAGNFYVLEAGEQGKAGIWRRDGDHWTDLLPWTPSSAVRTGTATNELAVHAIGQRLTFVVNGTEVASQVDDVLAHRGGVGVFVGGDLNEVVLQRLVVQMPTTAAASAAPVARGPGPDRVASPDSQGSPVATPATATPAPSRAITRVTIGRIALDAQVVPARLVDKAGGVTWEVPPFRVGHAEQTAGAGERGNAVLLGHVTSQSVGNVFQELDRVEVGDGMQIYSGSRRFEYRAVQVHRVGRTDVSVVQPTDAAAVTLITCTGAWLPGIRDYAERLVVRGELVTT